MSKLEGFSHSNMSPQSQFYVHRCKRGRKFYWKFQEFQKAWSKGKVRLVQRASGYLGAFFRLRVVCLWALSCFARKDPGGKGRGQSTALNQNVFVYRNIVF